MTNDDADLTGNLVDGRYRVARRLGHGGMGTVHIAEHVGLDVRRAIKFLRAEFARRPAELRRFLQEARTVSRLQHRHIVSVLDVGEAFGTAYYVMELLEGEDLRARLRREGSLPWSQIRAISLQICDALDAAHRGGVVHRDLKPENCFCVRQSDESVFIKVLDFGVAKVALEAGEARITGTGEALGTVGYMAPEQLEGVAHPSVDVYALGVMIYEMLAGRAPYVGNAAQVIGRIARGVPPAPLAEVCVGVAAEVEALVRRAMEHDARQRIPDMQAFARQLTAIPDDAMAGARTASGTATEPTHAIDAHGPTVAQGADLFAGERRGPGGPSAEEPLPHVSASLASAADQRLSHDFRTLVIIVLVTAAALLAAALWLRGPAGGQDVDRGGHEAP